MKQRILPILAFLLAGVVVNVAVAWAPALLLDPTRDMDPDIAHRMNISKGTSWSVNRFARPGMWFIISIRTSTGESRPLWVHGPEPGSLVPSSIDVSPSRAFLVTASDPPAATVTERRLVHLCGWPIRNLWCEWFEITEDRVVVATGGGGSIVTGLSAWGGVLPRVLPLRPLPLRFAANTVIYALLVAAIVLPPLRLRRRWHAVTATVPPAGQLDAGSAGVNGNE